MGDKMIRECRIGGCFERAVQGSEYCSECKLNRLLNGMDMPQTTADTKILKQAIEMRINDMLVEREKLKDRLEELTRAISNDDNWLNELREQEKFNYVIGTEWPNTKQLSVYALHNVVHWGSQEDAERVLGYVKDASPDKDWRIIRVGE